MKLWVATLCGFLLTFAGCGRPTARDEPLRPSQVHDFATLYKTHCSACHGAEGKLGPAPPLADAMFLAIISDEQMREVASQGRHGTMMPGFALENGGDLTPLQVDLLVEGIRSRWQGDVADADSLPAYAGDADDERAPPSAADEQLFARHCGSCHGKDGRGGDGGAIRVPAFLALISDQALRRIIITGRPDLGMPDYRRRASMAADSKPLTSDEIDRIVALLASWRNSTQSALADEQASR